MLRKCLRCICITFTILTVVLFAVNAVIFKKSFDDPRYRVFSWNSKQVPEGEIYNVAEIPAISDAAFSGERTLRLSFTPAIKTGSWTVIARRSGREIHRGPYCDIPFEEWETYEDTYDLVPEGVELKKNISVKIFFYPKENYINAGLTKDDYYWIMQSSVPLSKCAAHSLAEWTGLPNNDPELIEAKKIIEGLVPEHAPTLEKAELVFRFIMDKIVDSVGVPADEVQDATPLETYTFLSTYIGKGWCEQRALVYYLFANAAGVPTRLVDIAGQFGPLKLTTHYFCESWDPDTCSWFLVDPMSNVCRVQTPEEKLLSTLEIKHLFDSGQIDDCRTLEYDKETGELVDCDISNYYAGNFDYFSGDIVLAYKFGYPKNASYTKLEHFLKYPTLVYATFTVPRLYLIKNAFLYGFLFTLIVSMFSGLGLLIMGKQK